MINIVLFGAPGCGKGTQAQRLKEHYGIDHVSTGEVIRDEIRRGTELGRSMEQYISLPSLMYCSMLRPSSGAARSSDAAWNSTSAKASWLPTRSSSA